MKTISISQWVAAVVNHVAASRQSAANISGKWRRSAETPLRADFLALTLFILFSTLAASAQVNLPIGNLLPGEKVTITFDVTLTNSFPAGVVSVSNQGTVSGSNFSTVNTDDPQTVLVGDATITPVDVPPTVTTLAATIITPTSATLNAFVNPNGLVTFAYFKFGLTTGYGSNTTTNSVGAGSLAVLTNGVINNLTPGTLYNFVAVATNSAGTVIGSNFTFTTVAISPSLIKNVTRLGNGSLQFTFTNTPGQSFTVLASTNLALPTANWTVLGSATESPAGTFQFTDPQATNNIRRFYRVRWP